jgi:glycosyltransferase involved in cell wall biosynthesis
MRKDNRQEMVEMDDRPVKPVLIISQRMLGDYSVCLRHLLVGLADESVPVAVVSPAESSVELLVPLPIEVIKHPAYELPLLWVQNRRILLERLAKFGPTILHCLCESKAAFARQLSRQLGLPYVLTINSLQKRRTQVQISNSRCVKIIVPTKSIEKSITEKNPKLAERIVQINMGTFVEDQTCCFNDQKELVNMVTSFSGENAKAFGEFLKAIKHLAEDGFKFVLVVISEGRAERKLRKMLADPSFSEIVIVVPKLEPLRSILRAGDIYIRAVASDSFEPLLIEAMSVGNAVAACKGGAADIVLGEKTAAVFNEADEASIHDVLRNLLENREVARKLAKSSQEYLRKKHTVSAMVSATLKVYLQAQETAFKIHEVKL